MSAGGTVPPYIYVFKKGKYWKFDDKPKKGKPLGDLVEGGIRATIKFPGMHLPGGISHNGPALVIVYRTKWAQWAPKGGKGSKPSAKEGEPGAEEGAPASGEGEPGDEGGAPGTEEAGPGAGEGGSGAGKGTPGTKGGKPGTKGSEPIDISDTPIGNDTDKEPEPDLEDIGALILVQWPKSSGGKPGSDDSGPDDGSQPSDGSSPGDGSGPDDGSSPGDDGSGKGPGKGKGKGKGNDGEPSSPGKWRWAKIMDKKVCYVTIENNKMYWDGQCKQVTDDKNNFPPDIVAAIKTPKSKIWYYFDRNGKYCKRKDGDYTQVFV